MYLFRTIFTSVPSRYLEETFPTKNPATYFAASLLSFATPGAIHANIVNAIIASLPYIYYTLLLYLVK